MTGAATASYGAYSCGRASARSPYRRIVSGGAIGLGLVAAAGALAATATMVAAWMVSGALSSDSNVHARAAYGPRSLAIVEYRMPAPRFAEAPAPVRVASASAETPETTFESKWAGMTPSAPAPMLVPLPQAKRKIPPAPEKIRLAELTPPSTPGIPLPKLTAAPIRMVPLPRPHPITHEAARAPVKPAAPAPVKEPAAPVATVKPSPVAIAPAKEPTARTVPAKLPETTGSIPRDPPQQAQNRVTLPTPGSRTAVYDIAARTVYLPSGEKLEAHSGLGDKIDDPRFVHVRMRGATPPNVYNLALRESLFHGVQAIRLKPVDDDKMFGRDGILAHTYMLGPNGQSNGCVSFKNYAAFLRAFQQGEFDRLVVVANLGDTIPDLGRAPVRTARAPAARRWRVATSAPATTRRPESNVW